VQQRKAMSRVLCEDMTVAAGQQDRQSGPAIGDRAGKLQTANAGHDRVDRPALTLAIHRARKGRRVDQRGQMANVQRTASTCVSK
jgi:hypothetical protein